MTKHLQHSGQARFKGRASLFYVSKKNLNPSYWRIWSTKNDQKLNKIEKVMTPKAESVKNSKNKSPNITKLVTEHPKSS
jgi:hypothetical protein